MRIAIIGAGMAGASLAYFLAPNAETVLVEAEAYPGYHTTGRSAALYAKSYGNAVIRSLTVASEPFYTQPPIGFCEHPLLSPRGALFVARHDQRPALDALFRDIVENVPSARLIDAATAKAKVPILRDDYLAYALFEDDSRDMDVDGILQGFLKGARKAGAELRTNFRIDVIERTSAHWVLHSDSKRLEADIIVNAAGAWADSVANLANIGALDIQPKRRTAFLVAAPETVDPACWPITVEIEETFYVKPEAGMLLCSPADETPMPPMDAYPDDLDIAVAVDRIQGVMDLPVTRIGRSWAGLRSFAADKTPVVGFDPHAEGFFWLAGQGGYGIQTAPAMAQMAAHLLAGRPLDIEIDRKAVETALSPRRF